MDVVVVVVIIIIIIVVVAITGLYIYIYKRSRVFFTITMIIYATGLWRNYLSAVVFENCFFKVKKNLNGKRG